MEQTQPPLGANVRELPSTQVALLIQRAQVAVIDVRSHDERLVGKLPGAAELLFGPVRWTQRDVSAEDVSAFVRQVRMRFSDPSTPLIVFCNVGVRSRSAASALSAAGYTEVMTAREGFLGNRFGEGLQAHSF